MPQLPADTVEVVKRLVPGVEPPFIDRATVFPEPIGVSPSSL